MDLSAIFPAGTFFHNVLGLNTTISPFEGIGFDVLYSWLPSDIRATCGVVLTLFVVFFCIGIIKKLLPTA